MAGEFAEGGGEVVGTGGCVVYALAQILRRERPRMSASEKGIEKELVPLLTKYKPILGGHADPGDEALGKYHFALMHDYLRRRSITLKGLHKPAKRPFDLSDFERTKARTFLLIGLRSNKRRAGPNSQPFIRGAHFSWAHKQSWAHVVPMFRVENKKTKFRIREKGVREEHNENFLFNEEGESLFMQLTRVYYVIENK